jgi:hypothetical protein
MFIETFDKVEIARDFTSDRESFRTSVRNCVQAGALRFGMPSLIEWIASGWENIEKGRWSL